MLKPRELLGLIVGSILVQYAEARCPLGAVQGLNPADCYVYRSTAALWFKAEEDCTVQGGHLSSISNALINAFVTNVASKNCAAEVWIGGGWNVEQWLKWTWTDDKPFRFTKWAAGEPSNATSVLCLALNLASGRWRSRPCTDVIPYVCKIPALGQDPAPCNPDPTACTPCDPAPTCPEAPTTASIASLTCPPQATQAPCNCKPGQISDKCEDGWVYSQWSNKCYQLVDASNVTWTNAKAACQRIGADLPSIHSNKDNAWLSALALGSQVVGIGLYRKDRNAAWQWTDGSALDFSNWAPNNPFVCAGNYNSAVLITSFDLQQPFAAWTNCYAYWTFPVVCQKAVKGQ
ncbi:CLEC-50 protein [Aphelenchoides avenae]|nr:CLEC-50 protein [Aphelenchus avenae]